MHRTELFCQSLNENNVGLGHSVDMMNSYHRAAKNASEGYVLAEDNRRVISHQGITAEMCAG